MIKIENIEVVGLEHAIRGMRNPKNSWDKSDSMGDALGVNDLNLAKKLSKGGPVHAKYRRFITAYMDITAPLYWWKEFDTYRAGVEKNSCSTMHKIHAKEFSIDDFSCEHLFNNFYNQDNYDLMKLIVDRLEANRKLYLALDGEEANTAWQQMIQLLPSSYNQKRTVMISYEALANMYYWRKRHKLSEWRMFCSRIESLPYSELFTLKGELHG